MTTKMIKGFSIYEDYVIYLNDREKQHCPLIGGVTLQVLSEIVRRWDYYGAYLLRTQKIIMDKSIETDSSIFKDTYKFNYKNTESYVPDFYKRPCIYLEFKATNSDNYDYSAYRSRDTSTAHKRGRSQPSYETRFKAVQANIFREEGNADVWIQNEIARINSIMNQLDEETQTLESWAKSGIHMRVMCTNFCYTFDIPVISPKLLQNYAMKGFSIKDFREKLTCKRCGARNPNLKLG